MDAGRPGGPIFFQYVLSLTEPLRIGDFQSHISALGMPAFDPPVAVTSFMATSLRNGGEAVGIIYVTKGQNGEQFSAEDEEILVMFAAQAALVIANARRHREERQARSDLETLVNTAPVGVVVLDAGSGQVASINQEMRMIVSNLHGPDGSADEVLQTLSFRRADGREVSLQELPLSQTLQLGETVRGEEIVLSVPDGRSVTALLNATPIRSESGAVASMIVTLQDLTPMQEVERLRAEFLGMVSHELRTPLTAIKGSAVTLMETLTDLEPAEMRQYIRIITSQTDHMRDLLTHLLDVARIETGTLPVDPEPSEVRALVEEARSQYQSGGGQNDLQLEIPLELPAIMADRRRIVQVLGNLLSNAARSSPQSSPIKIEARLEGVYVMLSVSDDGLGIAADRLSQLFRKFTRIDDRGRDEDTGLGLAICRGIVEAHGGRIWAESDGPGQGSRFSFTIPAVEPTPAQAPKADRGARRNEHRRPRILAVDDDPQLLRYVRDILTNAGFTAVATADPDEVFDLLEENPPELVLLDLVLPGVDGIELMIDIRRMVDLPVIFLSAYGQDEVIARAFEQGAADYILKPFSATELTARIQATLRRRIRPTPVEPATPYELGALNIDYQERHVTLDGEPVHLTPVEYRLLAELAASAGQVLTNFQLLQRVWGPHKTGGYGPVRDIIKRLRRKLGDNARDPAYIFNEPRVGYMMPKQEEPSTEL